MRVQRVSPGLRSLELTPALIDKYKGNRGNFLYHLDPRSTGVALFDRRGSLVGYVGYLGDWIKGIWVNPEYRGRGIATDLLEYAVEEGGVKYSSVNKKNVPSLQLHKLAGFKGMREDKNMVYFRV